jgi:hypothetical protein
MLGNWWLVEKNLGFVIEVVVGYSALFLVELFGSLRLGTLFVKVVKGKGLSAGLYGLGLCVACSCMAGNTTKGIFGSWFGILGEG